MFGMKRCYEDPERSMSSFEGCLSEGAYDLSNDYGSTRVFVLCVLVHEDHFGEQKCSIFASEQRSWTCTYSIPYSRRKII